MKISTLFTSFALAGFSFSANTTVPDQLFVYATEKCNGSVSLGDKSAFMKSYTIAIANLTTRNVDLSTLCLRAYSTDNQEFTLDTVDEDLTQGILRRGKSIRGTAVFVSENNAIIKGALIKISDNCN